MVALGNGHVILFYALLALICLQVRA
jgi:hypothetical protein